MTAGSATTCIVVGAGLSGLLAATRLQEEGWQVTVVDKARGVGGRMATRRFEGGVFDHGAQFFTVRDARFAELVERWQQAGVVEEWSRGFAMPNRTRTFDGHPRYRGIPGMTGMPKHLASGLDLRLQTRVASVHPADDAWVVSIEDGSELQAHALIMTAPVPQALAMLAAGAVDLPETIRQALDRIDYDPCFAVMALLEGPSAIPVPGAIQMNSEPIAWVADNAHKGVSATPGAVTIHAGPEFSRAHIDDSEQVVANELLGAAEEWLGSPVKAYQVHRWLYSQPRIVHSERCLAVEMPQPLVLAGDAFGGPRIEGAALSGLAAAEHLLAKLG